MDKKTDKTHKEQPKKKRGNGVPFVKNDPRINLEGRPKGSVGFKTIFNEAIKKIAKTQDIDPNSIEVDLVIKGIAEARGGNYQFWRDIFDRNYGKPQQQVDITTKGESINEESRAKAKKAIDGALSEDS